MTRVAIGDVYAFTAARRWVPCQVIGRRGDDWLVVVFAALAVKRPTAKIVDGAPIYVLRHGRPRNEPLYLACDGPLPASYVRLGRRPVDLAFALPKTYRTSPRAGEDTLPVPATWAYAPDRVVDDLTKRPPPFHSRRFPRWTTVDARALRAIDTAVAKLAAARPVTLAALRRAIAATNRHADEIDTIRAEELFETLEKIARRGGLADPAAVIDAQRDW